MMGVQKGLGIKNIHDLARKEVCGIFETKNVTEEQKRKYIRTEREISKILTEHYKFKFAHSYFIEKIIKKWRGVKLQHFVLNKYYIDYYFPEHKLAVEINKKAHLDRNEDKDKTKKNK